MTEIPYSCFWDQTVNWVDFDDTKDKLGDNASPLTCWKCGKVNFPNAIKQSKRPGHVGENYLECIVYTGPLRHVPTGAITVGGVTRYITTDGRIMTREEFKAEFDNDPAEHIIERIKIHKLFHAGRRRRR